MRKIIIGFSNNRTKNPLSWLIKKVDGVPFSHMFISMYWKKIDKTVVYHSAKHSAHFVEFSNFEKNSNVYEMLEFEVSEEQYKEVLSLCVSTAGTKYGIKTLFGVGLRLLINKLGFDIRNPFEDGAKTFLCSEMVYKVCKILGMKEELDSENETLKPIYSMIKKFHKEYTNEQ